MTDEGVTIKPGSIGSSSEGVVKLILDDQELLEDAMLRLQGLAKLRDEEGRERVVQLEDREYNKPCIAWMRGKLEEILNKNMHLSHINEEDMYKEARTMGLDFVDEVWLNWRVFDLNIERFEELTNMYLNYLAQIVRHPLNKGIRELLTKTHSETTTRMDQRVSELSEKKGLLGGLIGRG